MPFYAGVTAIPKSFNVGDHWEFNRASARWAFDYTDFHAQVAYADAIQDIQKAQQEWETGASTKIPEIDKQAAELYAKSPAKAVQLLTKFSNDNADKVVAAWWDLGDKLLVKYNHFGFYDQDKRAGAAARPAPQIWRKAVRMADIWRSRKNNRRRPHDDPKNAGPVIGALAVLMPRRPRRPRASSGRDRSESPT